MLSKDYSNLIKQNPEIPGFATLLDSEALQKLLQSIVAVKDVLLKQIRFKSRRNCVVAYEMKVSGVSTNVYAKAYAPYGLNKIRKTLEQMRIEPSNLPRKIALEKEAIVVFFFPVDGKLKSLDHLVEPEKRACLMKELFPNNEERWESVARYLRYRPERRYSAQLSSQEKPWGLIKAYTKLGYPTGKTGAQTFRSKGSLRIPKLLGSSDKHRMLAFEWIPAIPLKEFLSARDMDFGMLETVGEAVAEMHSQNTDGLTPLSREDEVTDLIDRANLFCTLCPHLAGRVMSLASQLSRLVRQQPSINRPIHGDFYMGQIMVHGDKIVIVDFDQAALGDPARDFGLLVAQLTRDVLREELDPKRFEEVKSALLQGYQSKIDEACFARIPLYTTIGLFRLAAEPFRLCEPDWPRRMETILQRTEDFLQIPA